MIRIKSLRTLVCPVLVLFSTVCLAGTSIPSPKGASVSILSPADGAAVTSPVKITFGIEKMMLMPAGTPHTDSGHHHLLVDLNVLPALDLPIPADKNHIHFGKGQTETALELPPGKHTLQLMLGDHFHRPHNPPVLSKRITITVQGPAKAEQAKEVSKKEAVSSPK